MPILKNMRHEKFCREYIRLEGNGRRAYWAAGYQTNAAAADVSACRLIRQPKVMWRLQELRAMAAKRNDVTEDSLLDELEQARLSALELGQSGAAVQATMGKARITGHVVDRKEVGKPNDFKQMTDDELRQYIAKHLPSDRTANQTALDSNETAHVHASDSGVVGPSHDLDTPAPTHDGPNTKQ